MNKVTSRVMAAATAVAMLFAGAVGARAQSVGSGARANTATASSGVILNDVAGLTEQAILRYDRYVTYSPSRGFVAAIPAKVVKSDPSGAATVRRSVAASNHTLSRLTGTYVVSSAAGVTTVSSGGVVSLATRHGGINFSWWGITLWLDEYATNILVSGLAAGSGAAWVAAELTSWTGVGGLSGGAIAALLALGAAAIHLCDWNGRGVGFHLSYIGVGWCWAR
jgi:hypothetical protein